MADNVKKESLEDYHKRVLLENKQEHNLESLLKTPAYIVSFESRSNGKNRPKRRRSREVYLVVCPGVGRKSIAFQVVRGEIRSRKKHGGLNPDQLAQEALAYLPEEDRTRDNLLDVLLQIRSEKEKIK